jgi:hypothetical protein
VGVYIAEREREREREKSFNHCKYIYVTENRVLNTLVFLAENYISDAEK